MQAGGTLVFLCIERECCLLVLNLVSSTLSCIRRPRPRLAKPLSPGQHAKLTKHFQAPSARLVPGLYPLPRTKLLAQGTSNLHPSPSVLSLVRSLALTCFPPPYHPSRPHSLLHSCPPFFGVLALPLPTPLSRTDPPTDPPTHAARTLSLSGARSIARSLLLLALFLALSLLSFMCVSLSCSLAYPHTPARLSPPSAGRASYPRSALPTQSTSSMGV